MSLPNVNIILGNGNIGSVSISDDGISGLILTGAAVAGKLDLSRVYVLSSTRDLVSLGITTQNNPFLEKEIKAFYGQAGEGAELHLIVVSEATTLTQMCSNDADSALNKLINSAAGRIRLVGINRNPPTSYVPTIETGIDQDVITAIAAAQSLAESFTNQIAPFRVLLPALAWNGQSENLFQPRQGSYNRVSVILASDGKFGASKLYSAAVGQVLGRAAKSDVNISIARVRDGAIAASGFLTDGSKPEEKYSLWNMLYDAGYLFYRTFIGKNGYYLSDDACAIATTDDYNRLSLGRVIDKALVIAYKTYIDEIMESIYVDDDGKVSQPLCKSFEQNIIRAIYSNMEGEISSFTAFVDPNQDVITSGYLNIQCKIVPTALLREINVNLSFTNPNI